MRLNLLRLLPWVVLLAVAAATLSPIQMRPHTIAPPQVERFVAFAALGLSFALVYSRNWFMVLVGLSGVAFLLEAAQRLTPSRHWGLADLVAKIAGASFGIAIALLILLLSASLTRGLRRTAR